MRWLPTRAYENGIYAVFTNAVGIDHDTIKTGNGRDVVLGGLGNDLIFTQPDGVYDNGNVTVLSLNWARAATLEAVAVRAVSGDLALNRGAAPEAARRSLLEIRGIGEWTAQYVAMRALADPDAFPAGDLGLRQAFGGADPARERDLLAAAEGWRPWRAYAASLLWWGLADGTGHVRRDEGLRRGA